jgi:hypothetical protein
MNQLGQACLRFSALLHTRIIQEVLPALENVIAVMVADLQKRKFLPTRSHIHGETAVLVENVAGRSPKRLGELDA